jgi:hypothetical protein
VPLSRFQSEVLRTLAAQRSPDSYIAGGVAINRTGPRFSGDIDIFHDSEDRLEAAAQADAAALTATGYTITWERIRSGRREATVSRQGERMQLEWATDAVFRFGRCNTSGNYGDDGTHLGCRERYEAEH